MASVTPKQIYTALTNAGASTVQAIGIIANMLAESSLNPEAVGDQGTSFGLVQQHGLQYSGLVTGNPSNDMNAQIKTMAQNGGISAASGSTGAAAAGNFAANYERCTTCQPGQSSYNQRVSNAGIVAGWVASGNWPASAGSATAAASGGSGTTSNSTDPTCAWGFSGSLVVTSVNICVVKKATLRHIVGGLLLGGGGIVILAGAAILAASAFQRSGAARAVEQIASTTPAGRVVKVARGPTQAARRARALDLGCAGDQHGPPHVFRDRQRVPLRQLIDRGGELFPVPAGRFGDGLDHLLIPCLPDGGKPGLADGVFADPCRVLERRDH